jgi:hypothetical protein
MLINKVFRSFVAGIGKDSIGALKRSAARSTGEALYACQFTGIAV